MRASLLCAALLLAVGAGYPSAALGAGAVPDWRSIGPGGGGYYLCVVASPVGPGVVYASSDVGGFYKSVDGGKSWRICNGGLHSYYTQAIAPHPTDPNTIYIGTEGGVHKSTDGGESWHWLRTGFPPVSESSDTAPISALAIAPSEPDTVYAGVGRWVWDSGGAGTVYRTADGGGHWEVANPGGGGMDREAVVRELVVHPRDARRVYAATNRGLYRSDDGGRTWRRLSQGLPHGRTGRVALCQSRPEVMYLTLRSPRGRQPWQGGVYRSDDGGEHWTARSAGLETLVGEPGEPGPMTSNVDRVVVDPEDADVVYTGDESWVSAGLYGSTDGGRSWRRLTDTDDPNFERGWVTRMGICPSGIALDPLSPGTVYFCSSGHIFRTTDAGRHWNAAYTRRVPDPPGAPESTKGDWWRGTGAEVLCLNDVVVHPRDPGRLFLCYWDVGLLQSFDGGRTFTRTTDGMRYLDNVFTVAFDPDDPQVIYAATGEWGNNRGDVCRSDDGGFRWRVVGRPETGLPDGQVHDLFVDWDPSTPLRRVYAAVEDHGVYCSEDGGQSWKARNRGLPDIPGSFIGIGGLVQDPREPRTLYLLLGRQGLEPGGLFRSDDRGLSWRRESGGMPGPRPQALAICPSDPRRLYVAARQGEGADGKVHPGGVFASRDGGATWTRVLDEAFVRALAVDPTSADVVYAGCTDHPYHDDSVGHGVMRSRDGGRTWESLNSPTLANRDTDSLTLDPHHPGRLYVGTGGDGVFVREE